MLTPLQRPKPKLILAQPSSQVSHLLLHGRNPLYRGVPNGALELVAPRLRSMLHRYRGRGPRQLRPLFISRRASSRQIGRQCVTRACWRLGSLRALSLQGAGEAGWWRERASGSGTDSQRDTRSRWSALGTWCGAFVEAKSRMYPAGSSGCLCGVRAGENLTLVHAAVMSGVGDAILVSMECSMSAPPEAASMSIEKDRLCEVTAAQGGGTSCGAA